MKSIALLLVAMITAGSITAQTIIDKTIPVSSGQHVTLHFDYPELVRVSTWEKSEISIHCSVSINQGENDDAFELLTATEGKVVSIRNEIKNLNTLPQRITVVDGAERLTFKDRAALKKYQQ